MQWYILPHDVDEDGLTDLLVSSWSMRDLVWYKNLYNKTHLTSLDISRIFIHSLGDTLIINTEMVNPGDHSTEVFAIIEGDKNTFRDSVQLFDDGFHGDKNASDNIYGEIWLPNIPEDMYTISLALNDLTDNYSYAPPFNERFTTKGPIEIENLEITSTDSIPNPGDRIKFSITLQNLGITDTVYDVNVKIIISDSTIQNTTTGKPKFGDIPPGEYLTSSSRDFALSFRYGDDTCSVGSYE
jgi:hypothetical protein